MGKATIINNVWSRGAVDPGLHGRDDLDLYAKGAASIENLESRTHGGLALRPGLTYAADLAAAGTPHRLRRFIFDPDRLNPVAYLMVFTPNECRVFKGAVLVAHLTGLPWGAAELPEIDLASGLDTLLIVHPSMKPKRLLRLGRDDAWTAEDVALTNIPTFEFGRRFPKRGITLSDATVGAGRTVTVDADWFEAGDVGATIGADAGRATITAYVSPTQVTASVTVAFAAPTFASGYWWFDRSTISDPAGRKELVWSERRGWPAAVGFHDGRTYFGGAVERRGTANGSKSGEYFNFGVSAEPLDDEAVEATLTEGSNAGIRRFYSLGRLFILSSDGVYVCPDRVITPGDFLPSRHNEVAASPIDPVEVEGAPVMIGGGEGEQRESAYELIFDDKSERYLANDLAVLSPFLIRPPLRDMAYCVGPSQKAVNHLILVNGGDGSLAVLNTRRAQQIAAWCLYRTVGGAFTASAAVSGRIWVAVERQGRLLLEYFDPAAAHDGAVSFASETPLGSVTVPAHLREVEIGVHVQSEAGWRHIGFSTPGADGVLDLPDGVTQARMGRPIEWKLEPLEPAFRDDSGAGLQGRQYRVLRLLVRVNGTGELDVDGVPLVLPRFGGLLDAAVPLVTGTLERRFVGWRRGGDGLPATGILTGRRGLPVEILAMQREVVAYG
ncbi:hypothetical protein [Ferrovibrio sp.]|uniref:hypothetical protein n=1 Tax=Ferrovibrio sp. TaxID=1917215 RepID=UPI003D0AEFB0